MTKLAIHGAAGRMGRALVQLIAADPRLQLVAAVDRAESAHLGSDAGQLAGLAAPMGVAISSDLDAALDLADVVVDFSLPAGVVPLLDACRARKRPAVVGTTGLDADGIAAVDALAQVAPVVFAANYSVGVNVLLHLAARAVELAGPGYDIEIIEMHHRHKLDAPSGTARRLGEAVANARGQGPEAFVYGRSGQVGARRDDEIGIMTLRGGEVIGDHTVMLAGSGERLELTHRAQRREVFAEGALRAAAWVVDQAPGRYEMADVLGIPRA